MTTYDLWFSVVKTTKYAKTHPHFRELFPLVPAPGGIGARCEPGYEARGEYSLGVIWYGKIATNCFTLK
jgi:hypothetical protein